MTVETSRGTALVGWRRGLAFGLLVLVGVTWGSTYSIAKIVTEAGFHPLGMTLWQGLGGGLVLLLVCLVRRRLPPLGLRHVRFYLLCGLLGTAVPSVVWFWVAPQLQSGIVAITSALVPIVTLTLALAFRVERFETRRAIGITLGFVAIFLIVVPESSLPERAMVGWVLISLAIPVCYASENMVITLMRPPAMDTLTLLCGMLFACAAIMTPLVALFGGWIDFTATWTPAHEYFVVLMALNVLSYGMFIELLRMAGPVFAAQGGYVITASGVVWGIAVFDETHSVWVWLAIGLMFLGFALVSPRLGVQPR